MAQHLHLAADVARFVHDANGRLFDRDIQTGIMLYAALLHLMLVTARLQTTFIISLKRSTPALLLGARPAEYPI
jgi:hypothetical protein